jgi:hypothetical protein
MPWNPMNERRKLGGGEGHLNGDLWIHRGLTSFVSSGSPIRGSVSPTAQMAKDRILNPFACLGSFPGRAGAIKRLEFGTNGMCTGGLKAQEQSTYCLELGGH